MGVRPPAARRLNGARRPARLLLSFISACVLVTSHPALAQTPAAPASNTQQPAPSTPFAWRAMLAHGDAAGVEAFAAANPAHPDVAPARAALARRRGDDNGALDLLKKAVAAGTNVDASLELGLLLAEMGRLEDARTALMSVASGLGPNDPGMAYARVARAVAAVGDPRQADGLFRMAASRAPDDPQIYTWWADLYVARHAAPADIARTYRDAIERDPKWAPAHLGLARGLAESDPDIAHEALQKATSIDPALVEAHLMFVDQALDADQRTAAMTSLERAIKAGGDRYDVQARKAVMALLDDKRAEFDTLAAALLERRPGSGEVFRLAALAVSRQYRFDEAVELGRKAVATNENDIRAWAELGMHLSRAGDETAAYEALTKAFRADPYDPITYNLLNMLETLNAFATITHDVATIRIHKSEQDLLEPYVKDIVTKALDSFEERYGHRPKAPLHVQVFNDHDDFAVRTTALPGVLLQALGVCFGRVVAMVSPKARRPGSFSWQETLWHELAHVVTLQLSNQRVPRWLTEGISVYEERRGRPGWGREGDLSFAQALGAGKALRLTELEGGFTRGDTIGLAYYEASLLVEHIERHEGIDAIRRLLKAYGEGLSTDAAIKRELGMDLAALDKRFFDDVTARYATLSAALAPPTGAGDAKIHGPNTLAGLLAQGDAALADNNTEAARMAYERAAALVPNASGELSPHMRLANLAMKEGDRARARASLRAALDADYANVEIARRLAVLADEDKDADASRAAWSRIIEIDPFDPAAHSREGRAAMAAGKFDTAEREFRAAIAAGAVNLPDAYTDLGEALLSLGRNDEARRHAVRALENAPMFERAQMLLLKSIGKDK